MSESLLRIVGHQLTVVPRPPYRVSRLKPSGRRPEGAILYEHRAGDDEHRVMIVPGEARSSEGALERRLLSDGDQSVWAYLLGEQGPRAILNPGLETLDDVCDLGPGPAHERWDIETTLYSVSWPEGFRLTSAGDDATAIFDFRGTDGALVYLQGPFTAGSVPAPAARVGPGQRTVDEGLQGFARWAELAYEHRGEPWLQRHYVVSLDAADDVTITAQAPVAQREAAFGAADQLVRSIRPLDTSMH